MAYAYCSHPGCECGVPFPTIRQAFAGEVECYAGHANTLTVSEVPYIVEQLADRLELLETQVSDLTTRLDAQGF